MEKSTEGQGITDLSYLSELSKGNEEFIREMVELFLLENPREIAMLEEGIRDRNFYAINLAAHKLRSTLPFVGIDKFIQREIEEIEQISLNNSAVQKLVITPDEDYDIKKVEIVTMDRKVIREIEKLFPKVKIVCEQARLELSK
jgi:HPt (histidine-containing phosphotransfer) domain-containing protein